MFIIGYFTIERNIRGLTTKEMERALGFRPGRLTYGARVLVLNREPRQGEFVPAGSTFFPGSTGLNAKELKRTALSYAGCTSKNDCTNASNVLRRLVRITGLNCCPCWSGPG
jgi:hypothetical protein